jgi:hypothetical protein
MVAFAFGKDIFIIGVVETPPASLPSASYCKLPKACGSVYSNDITQKSLITPLYVDVKWCRAAQILLWLVDGSVKWLE